MKNIILIAILAITYPAFAKADLNLPKGHLYILDVRGLDIPQGEKRGAGPNKMSAEMFSQIASSQDGEGHDRLVNLGKLLLGKPGSAGHTRGYVVVYLNSLHGSHTSSFRLRLYFTDTFGNFGRSPYGEALYREVTTPMELNRFLSKGESLVYVHRGRYHEPRMSDLSRQTPSPARYRQGDDVNALAMVGVLMPDGKLIPLEEYLDSI